MGDFSIEEGNKMRNPGAKIKVIGVGGGGGNMINHIVREGINQLSGMRTVDLIAANTDVQALDSTLEPTTPITLGEKTTRGLGAGQQPEVGKKAAEESYDEVKTVLEQSDIVFVSAGMGGGTGTGAAPVVVRAAKEVGALTVAIVTTPFSFEGKKRMRLALEGIEELRKECDSIVIIPNQKLSSIVDRRAGYKECFKVVDKVLAQAVSGMTSIILDSGNGDVNLDFADVRTAMSHRGLSLMGVGDAKGEAAASEALKNATQSPLLENMNVKKAKGMLVNFKFNPNYPFIEIEEAMTMLQEDMESDEADVFFGTVTDESMDEDLVEVTVIATGFDDNREKAKPAESASENAEKAADKKAAQAVSNDLFSAFAGRKVSGGYEFDLDSDELDKPAILRHRLD